MMKRAIAGLSALCLAYTGNLNADTATTTFDVTATVVSVCYVSADPLAFGNYDTFSGSDYDTNTSVYVSCSNTTAYEVGIDAGLGAGATVAVRKMTNGGNTLNYSLYSDAGRTTVWGNTTGVDVVAGVGDGTTQTLTVYGRAPMSQTSPPAAYIDTVTVTVTY